MNTIFNTNPALLICYTKIVHFRVYCSKINYAFLPKAAMLSDCTLQHRHVPCGLYVTCKERKKNTDDHLNIATGLARLSSTKQSSSGSVDLHGAHFRGWNKYAGTYPAKGAPWCSFSRMVHKFAREFVRRCTVTGGERIRCYTFTRREGRTLREIFAS